MGKHILQTQKLCPGNKNVFDPRQKQFLFPSSKICFRNICFPPGWTSKHLPPQQCFRNNASATMFPSLARPLRILLMFLRPNFLLLWFFRSKQTSAYLLKVCSKKLLCLVTWPALARVVGVDERWPSRWMARMYRPFFFGLPVKPSACQIQTWGVAYLYNSNVIILYLTCFTGLPDTLTRFHILQRLIRSFFIET